MLDLISNRKFTARVLRRIGFYWLTRRYIRMLKPDILHTHLKLNRYVKFAKPDYKIKIFHTIHSEPKVLWFDGNRKFKLDFQAAKWLAKQRGMRFIALHDDMRIEVNELFGVDNTVVLNNGIDFSRFERKFDTMEIRKMNNIPNNAFVIGHVGRFSPEKNHLFLIDVFAEIHKQRKDAFLLLIGSGPEMDSVKAKLKSLNLDDQCIILSNRTDIPALLSAMDVFIFPSEYEGLGISLIEAQLKGLRCIVSSNVPCAATISNLVCRKDLKETPTKWAESALDKWDRDVEYYNVEKWDMREIVKELAMIYEGK